MFYFILLGLIIVLTVILTFVAQILVSAARTKYKIVAPTILGDINFERVFRAHQNQLEANNLFLPLVYLQFPIGAILLNILTSSFGGMSEGDMVLNLILTTLLLPNFIWLIGRALYVYGYNTNQSNIKMIGGIGAGIAFVFVLLIVIIGGLAPFVIF